MIRTFLFAAGLIVAALPAWAQRPHLIETPSLAADVLRGALPPVDARVPLEPLVMTPDQLGRHGGELRILMSAAKDARLMVVYGYARLIRYTPSLDLVPDIAKAVEVEEGRRFTFRLRDGHKWSDGSPFTAEDFRYWYEDIASNKDLTPGGLTHELLVDGERPRVEFPDPLTIRYTWSKPNPLFLSKLAAPNPIYIFAPSQYLKRFHAKYADPEKLQAMVKESGQRNWAALHTRKNTQYHNDNPDLPSLEPWVVRTAPPSDRFMFTRNPFFHRIDASGRQLPYIDTVAMAIADSKIIPVKVGAGEADLQARYLRFDNYTFLKEAEERNGYKVKLWHTAPGSQLALYPNLNVNDPVWRTLNRDVRFRRALSLAINRHEINQVIYYGLAIEGQNTVLPESPLYNPGYRTAWAKFDLKAANKLLDEIGLAKRNSAGIRLLPDGRPLEIIVENAGESSEQADVLELIRDSWRDAGIKLFTKPAQLTVFRNRVFAGETIMSVDKGLENGLPTPDMPPMELAPMSQQQLQWPKWGQHVETKGRAGEPPELPEARQLVHLLKEWFASATRAEREEVWRKMLEINADQVFSIGLIAGVKQPVVANARLRNVPEEGVYNWDPGAHFGIYSPDTFWFEQAHTAQADAEKR